MSANNINISKKLIRNKNKTRKRRQGKEYAINICGGEIL